MNDVFVSYVEEDSATAFGLGAGLEQAGYTTWLYERHSLPGLSYLKQTRQAIDAARSFLLLISPASVRSNQVEKEVVRAHETGIPIVPILAGMTFSDFQTARPEWHQAIGAVVAFRLSPDGVPAAVRQIAAGLSALGIRPAARPDQDNREPAPAAGVPPDPAADPGEDANTVAPWEEAEDGAEDGAEAADFPALFVQEHPATGFLADVVIPAAARLEGDRLPVAFSHQLLGPAPFRVVVRVPSENSDPIQYLRLPNLIHGFAAVLRVHWLDRLPHRQPVGGPAACQGPAVRAAHSRDGVALGDAVGIVRDGAYTTLIPPGTPLPCVFKKRFRTVKDSQKAISITPAVRTADDQVREFPKLRVSVFPGPAGAVWLECTFRVDPDGRYSVFARSPLCGMRIVDMVVQ